MRLWKPKGQRWELVKITLAKGTFKEFGLLYVLWKCDIFVGPVPLIKTGIVLNIIAAIAAHLLLR